MAIWLLRQPPIVFLVTRLWVDSTRAVKDLNSEVRQNAAVGLKQQQLKANEEEEEEEEDVEAQLKALEAGLIQAQSTETAFDFTTYVSRYLRAVGTLSKAAMPGASVLTAAATVAVAPTGAASKEPEPPATSLAAAAVASTSALTANPATKWQPPPSLPLPYQPSAAFLDPLPPFSSSSSPLTTLPSSSRLSADSPEEPSTSAMADVCDDMPNESTPMILMLHTCCWPSTRWLDALAAAATARLYTPGFRAQSLGMLLWSLAGLGYRPQTGWLQPWLRRAAELVGDFRANNLTSVLCALSAWGEMPVGIPAAALRTTLLRLLPTMGARELQLTASALAQLCELPPCQPTEVADVKGLGKPTPTDRGGDGRTMGREFSPGRGSSSISGISIRSRKSRDSSGGADGSVGLFVPVSQVSDARDVKHGDVGPDSGRGVRPTGQMQRLVMPRHRRLEPRIEKLLVQRAVQVSHSYNPRHMARMLRLLVLRLRCIGDLADLQALLLGNAMHLEAVVAEPSQRRRWQRRRHRRWRYDTDSASSGKNRGNEGRGIPEGGHSAAAAAAGRGVEVGWDLDLTQERELRELAAAALDAARAVGPRGTSLSDEEAAMLLPGRWWRAYLTVLDASPFRGQL
ncbi:hypothetical protein Vafri_13971 [Volvox africanus]|nr:hypothetical protein Vafri_13971 [Volvox africanus]